MPLPVREVAKRVWKELSEDNVGLLAAGMAFYAMLALFPSLIALVTIYGLVADPARVADQVEPITKVVPESVSELLVGELTVVASASGRNLTLGLVISILAALWAASGGVSALITGINAVYDEPERRNFLRLKALALAMTLGGVIVAVLALLLVAAFPAAVNAMHLGGLSRVSHFDSYRNVCQCTVL